MDIQITWHHIEPSPALEADIRNRFAKLQKFCNEITSARISVDQPNHPHNRPHRFRVLLELQVPHSTIIAHDGGNDSNSHDVHKMVHQAFDAARRQVQDYVRIRQRKVKRHSLDLDQPTFDS